MQLPTVTCSKTAACSGLKGDGGERLLPKFSSFPSESAAVRGVDMWPSGRGEKCGGGGLEGSPEDSTGSRQAPVHPASWSTRAATVRSEGPLSAYFF